MHYLYKANKPKHLSSILKRILFSQNTHSFKKTLNTINNILNKKHLSQKEVLFKRHILTLIEYHIVKNIKLLRILNCVNGILNGVYDKYS